ncbi:ANTAR domain-containing protein [Spiribacter sp. 2438]|uniref:ANTAR domain-containing response regulator n=1 Tax=Spiribacter sp. 2438 TaxID=2666185 RepID=UPI0012AFB8DC|nr:ANTAR domain-containing protein [Spiribacter sp. 2438]QGM21722.1 ANTAR domain-containing protein [Spiribacter sp. 2438]
MRVLVIQAAEPSDSLMVSGLENAGYEVIVADDSSVAVTAAMDRNVPDVVIIDSGSAQRDMIEDAAHRMRPFTQPVIVLDSSGAEKPTPALSQLGLSVYAREHVSPPTLGAIIEASVSQYSANQELLNQLGAARQQVEEERVIARAKALLVEKRGMGEAEAHKWLRKNAMEHNRRLFDIAEIVLRNI